MNFIKEIKVFFEDLISSKDNQQENQETQETKGSIEKLEDKHKKPLSDSLTKANSDLEKLLSEPKLSNKSKQSLAEDLRQLNRLINKIQEKQFHISVFGRVSVGKSSLLNALVGDNIFSTSVLHGETKETKDIFWQQLEDNGLIFIDTPGIDEVDGKSREQIAKQAISSSDMVLFVVDGDLTAIEFEALSFAAKQPKPIILVINKTDRINENQKSQIKESIENKLNKIDRKIEFIFVSASPNKKEIIRVHEDGSEEIEQIFPESNIENLKLLIWEQIKESGSILQTMSAAIFTTNITDKIGEEIVKARSDIANKIITKYSITKALLVGLNPVPLLDMAVVFADVIMVKHLASVYGFEINKKESAGLIKSILAEMTLVLGASFGIQALASILKGVSVGLSTVLTASTQGGAAYYGTYLVGKACEEYFKKGASWGDDGAQKVLNDLLETIDKEDIMQEAKQEIQSILKK